jgi:L-lactate dehydrogenase complex protein LldE
MASASPPANGRPVECGSPVVVFPTCLGDLLTPDVPERAIAVLRRVGVDARGVCDGTCCGQPAFSAGHHGPARRVARATLRALDRTDGDIVVVAGSCAAMIRRHWRELFAGDRDEPAARRVASRVVETSQVLAARVGDLTDLGLTWNARIGYHDSCHMLRELRLRDEPRQVLATVRGLEVVDLRHSDRCCGFGGTFSFRYPGVSLAMADTKLDEVVELELDALVSCDGGCLLQLAGRADARGVPVRAVHLVDVLYEAGAA